MELLYTWVRNQVVFEDCIPNPMNTALEVPKRKLLKSPISLGNFAFNLTSSWTLPQSGWYKVNFDVPFGLTFP
jgi:hypothetical protein